MKKIIVFLSIIMPVQFGSVQAQTNDPRINQQQYLFDVHHFDQAWTYTKGSSANQVALHSLLGFRQSHEDLSSSRLLAPVGASLRPELDYGTEMAGIFGASSNNSIGIAGIDWYSKIKSFSVLRPKQTGDNPDFVMTFQPAGGAAEQFFFDVNQASQLMNQARTGGAKVHLFSYGIPSGERDDAELYYKPLSNRDSVAFGIPVPGVNTNIPGEIYKTNFVKMLRELLWDTVVKGIIFGNYGPEPPSPYKLFRSAIGNAVVQDGAVIVAPAGDLSTTTQSSSDFAPVLPAMMEKYAIAIGGVRKSVSGLLVHHQET